MSLIKWIKRPVSFPVPFFEARYTQLYNSTLFFHVLWISRFCHLERGKDMGLGRTRFRNTEDLNIQEDALCQGLSIGPTSHQLALRAL